MTEIVKVDTAAVVARWTDPTRRPLFKGSLIDQDGCKCAQGDILSCDLGWSDAQLRAVDQFTADGEVAKALGISRTHAILLRQVNDSRPGSPQDVLTNPEKVIGDQAPTILAFWRHIDRMTADDWKAVSAARAATWDAAWAAAWDAAWDAARAAAWAATWAVSEIQGAAKMRERGQSFIFLPMFGFADPEAVLAADAKAG